ncbi:hypothetical protein EJ03DRAFT_348828 [Teratosphaeria nubilosa]|uniref:Uncharacterized protein n=1 Tax=Teratosphaeria nubilosa TaxID=161662 RepID=A0A6G1LGL3_9PEZI|nr:hypothetical protein EJ03DRAFT_348828 [Teratosphaeria nubilosa]
MPPKSSKKAKEQTPDAPKVKQEPKTPSAPKKAAPKKKEPLHFEAVKKTGDAALAIDEGGLYTHNITLTAPAPFDLIGTLVYTTGEYEGNQAIMIRPARPFPFMKLPKELRARIYNFYFAQKGVVGDTILLDGKRSNKDVYAKTYAEGHKNRVGLLAVSKEISTEATPRLYTLPLRLDSTGTLLDFLSQLPTPVRTRLQNLTIKTFIKTSSRNAMHFLAEARNLQRFHIESGVFGDADPAKAAKQFYAEAYKFLEAVGSVQGRKDAGVDVLGFGPMALTYKDAKKEVKPWAEAMVSEFREILRAKLK